VVRPATSFYNGVMTLSNGIAGLFLFSGLALAQAQLRIAAFQADVTPPIGNALCCDTGIKPAIRIVDPLSARGVILYGAGKPIVLAALDWVGVAGEGWDEWRRELAKAAGTEMDRVTVNTIHVHDAPEYDPGSGRLVAPYGLEEKMHNPVFVKEALARVLAAVREAAGKAQPVTHLGLGRAKVEKVASNRRILGPDGKVRAGRMSSCKIPELRAEPEGVIDPYLRLVSFWQKERPVAAISFYASHPQSYYGQGGVSYDFPGMARAMREKALPGVHLVHFNGAGGNVAAGKYNDGSPENRPILAQRLADGMKAAWDATVKTPIRPRDVDWMVLPVALPPSPALADHDRLRKIIADESQPVRPRLAASHNLAWVASCAAGRKIPLFRLSLGDARLIYMPGELFVEYALAAQDMQPGKFVAMAAYGDYSPGYIGTKIAYAQGGYEAGPASRTAPEVEDVLLPALRKLLAR